MRNLFFRSCSTEIRRHCYSFVSSFSRNSQEFFRPLYALSHCSASPPPPFPYPLSFSLTPPLPIPASMCLSMDLYGSLLILWNSCTSPKTTFLIFFRTSIHHFLFFTDTLKNFVFLPFKSSILHPSKLISPPKCDWKRSSLLYSAYRCGRLQTMSIFRQALRYKGRGDKSSNRRQWRH